jgi:hypothetical protein
MNKPLQMMPESIKIERIDIPDNAAGLLQQVLKVQFEILAQNRKLIDFLTSPLPSMLELEKING